jgi:hypothetical protein
MKWVPFTAHIKIKPANPGKRFEYWRDMQKIAGLVYEGLQTIAPTTINIAEPNGGVSRNFGGTEGGGLSGYAYGTAAKPQFGHYPAQLMFTGFHKVEASNTQIHDDIQRFNAGDVDAGAAQASNINNPKTAMENGLKALKSSLEAAITAALPAGAEYSVYSIDYSGVVYGNKGYHFPK